MKSGTLFAFARAIHSGWATTDGLLKSRDDFKKAKLYVMDIIAQGITNTNFQELYGPGLKDVAAEHAKQCVLTCFETGNQHLLEDISDKVAATAPTTASAMMLPLLELLDKFLKPLPAFLRPMHGLRKFYHVAIPALVDTIDMEEPTEKALITIFRITSWFEDVGILEET